MDPTYQQILEQARSQRKSTRKLIDRLGQVKDRALDEQMQLAHQAAFERIDCLQCANCCKTTGPLFTARDIDRLAAHLRMKPSAFAAKYLRVDEDGDHVLQRVPCHFLNADNTCSVYDIRPKACREYPHTDRGKQTQILHLTEHNARVCPAVYEILQTVKQRLGM